MELCFPITSSRLGTALTALHTSSMNRFVFLLQLACLTIQQYNNFFASKQKPGGTLEYHCFKTTAATKH